MLGSVEGGRGGADGERERQTYLLPTFNARALAAFGIFSGVGRLRHDVLLVVGCWYEKIAYSFVAGSSR